ncbi:MAG: NADP-dependent oxidoreductase [Rhodoferax sp.]|jgi:NADPH-dependent curcumin reductase CurA|uniref:NADP-dependent oxidoreductase n=1 Tax=Rhodoferax sp. TaxID=50421 RepID=UPI001B5AC0DE|nr:NADP-dependent oxidoreductase [Rhodoferax sp.]MBP9737712.1 NADP-dependent oxidoreductase [Rhodoferax sp.]
MSATINHQFKLAARPVGSVKTSDWSRTEEAVRAPAEGEVVIQVLYLSLDPAMRGWMNESKASYIPPVGINEVMRALALGKVTASKNPKFAVGDHVTGLLGVQEYAYSNGQGLTKVDPKLAPLPVYLGTLGMPGMTGYFGLLEVGQPKAGDTVVVSGAAGAVGSVVGQIAKIKGARVVGIAGGADKCRYLVEELGFDAAIDYKTENVAEALKAHCPNGVNVYFDNVGGDILDAVLTRLARGARIVICGAISQYNNTTPVKGPANYLALLVQRASMTGIVVSDYYDRAGEAAMVMAGWIQAGRLKTREDIVDGLDNFPNAFDMLFTGANNGKLVLKVA